MNDKNLFERKSYKTENYILYRIAIDVILRAIQDAGKENKKVDRNAQFQGYYRNSMRMKYKADAIEFLLNLEDSIYWDILRLSPQEYNNIKLKAGLL